MGSVLLIVLVICVVLFGFYVFTLCLVSMSSPCVWFLCLHPVFCVPNVVSVPRLSILYCPFRFIRAPDFTPSFSVVRVTRSLVFFVVFSTFCLVIVLSVLLLLVIVLSVLLLLVIVLSVLLLLVIVLSVLILLVIVLSVLLLVIVLSVLLLLVIVLSVLLLVIVLSVLLLLVIVLSVLLRLTDSDYPFGISNSFHLKLDSISYKQSITQS